MYTYSEAVNLKKMLGNNNDNCASKTNQDQIFESICYTNITLKAEFLKLFQEEYKEEEED